MNRDNQRQTIFLIAALGNGLYGDSLLRAFQGFGHRVMAINKRRYMPPALSFASRVIRKLMSKVNLTRFNHAVITGACRMKPDLIVVMKGVNLVPSSLLTIRKKMPGCTLINVNYDDYLSASPGNYFSHLNRVIPCYDYFFPSKKVNVEELIELGARNVRYLPLGYDPSIHYPLSISPEEARFYRAEVSFIGTHTRERAQLLSTITDYKLMIWGDLWTMRHLEPNLIRAATNRLALGQEFSKVVGCSRISLNFLREGNRDTHNLKTFELPACGGFVISQRSDELGDFFEDGKEVVTFEGVQELKDKIDYYLRHDEEREKIARAAYQRLQRGKHTIRDRMETMLEQIKR